MLNDYLPIIILIVLATAMGFLVIVIGSVFGPRRPSNRKAAPYESGMIPYGPGTRRLSVRYYLVAVLFILFDIETVFFLPWAVVFRQMGWFALLEMLVFIGILLIGFVYVWKKGALEWE
jgi:NADH-quinone oxidoreductase subunit A